ncbi:hypothetical protein [Streptomyces lincolnensis]|uniref:hypothetical protein n=1 Tax=Streptomyces lincolnensis TaxID=1915 RepID=UPI0037D83F37
MSYAISRALHRVRALFIPRGKHRTKALPARVMPLGELADSGIHTAPTSRRTRAIAPTVRPWYEPIDGAESPLVRPYLTAYEHEEKARLQRLRRDTLWCATYGIDLDTRDIHAVLGAAS